MTYTTDEQRLLHDYAAAQAEATRLRVLLAECPDELRDAVRAELARAEDVFARVEAVAREIARRRSAA